MTRLNEVAVKYYVLEFSNYPEEQAASKLHVAKNVENVADLRHYMNLHHEFIVEEANSALENAFEIILKFNGIQLEGRSWKYETCSDTYLEAIRQSKQDWRFIDLDQAWEG